MQQILIIHGGDSFETYEEYIQSLQEKDYSLDRLRKHEWKGTLSEALGENFDVLNPRMPNAQNARYLEWKIVFEKIAPQLSEGIILIGHSLGGLFLAKYLTEENFPHRIRATFLIASPFITESDTSLKNFRVTGDFGKMKKQAGEIFLCHSKDDKVVSFSSVEKYQQVLHDAHLKEFSDKNHFNQTSFPELVEMLQKFS